jgi:hypothetical protein
MIHNLSHADRWSEELPSAPKNEKHRFTHEIFCPLSENQMVRLNTVSSGKSRDVSLNSAIFHDIVPVSCKVIPDSVKRGRIVYPSIS